MCVFGSIATEITGSGKFIASRMIGWSGWQIVSPVLTFLSPMIATISPANTSSRSSRLFACIWRSRPTRSFLSFDALTT